MVQWFQELLDSLIGALQQVVDWLSGMLSDLFLSIWGSILDSLASLLEAIPLPQWWASIGGLFSGISSHVIWFVDPFEFGTGLSIIGSAYLIRFLIRRLPLVG